jgi:predicted nucleotidyltransferase
VTSDRELADLVARSRQRLLDPTGRAPRAIALFGSRAKGEAGPDSDVDLLLVTDDGPECSRFVAAEGLELHASYLPVARLAGEPPAKWWEPLATARILDPGPDDRLGAAIERARALFRDPAARARRAAESAATLRRRLAATTAAGGDDDPAHTAELRRVADGALSVACFLQGLAEPSKRRRVSGLAAALGGSPTAAALTPYRRALGLDAPAPGSVGELRAQARDAFAGYRAWIERHEREPLLRSLLDGPNRWWVDTARAAGEHHRDDVAAYLLFVLDRLLLETPGPRAALLVEPWWRALTARLRAPAHLEAAADCAAVLERALPPAAAEAR